MPTRRQPADHVEPPAAEAAPRTAAPPSQEEWAVRAALQAAAEEVPAVAARLGPRFARAEARRRAQVYLRGLLSPVERKNGWQLAEAAGDRTPYATQHLLGRADWDPDAVREDLRTYVVEHLGDPGAVLVVDETGVVKKGAASAGVAKQYVGCVGKVENAQVGVFLAYASPQGVAFLDRALYLPQEWTDDPVRCRQAGIPAGVEFATKPELAQAMLARARAAGVPAAWVTADSVYGDDRSLRVWLETQRHPFVLAVSGKEYVNVAATWTQRRVSTLLHDLQLLPAEAWQRLSAGDGEQGPRLYDWYGLPLIPPLPAMSGGVWCGAACATPTTCRPTWSSRPQAPSWRRWCRSRGGAGRLRWPSRRPRARSGWTSTRCVAGPAGIATSRWRSSPRPCLRSSVST